MPRKNKSDPAAPGSGDSIATIKYSAKRKNIPPAGLEAQGRIGETARLRYEYNPHLPPVLRSATDAAETDVIEEGAFDALSGLKSLPFPRPARLGKGESWRVAVKVIDPRGNEGLT